MYLAFGNPWMFAKVVVKRGQIVFNKNVESTSKGWILLFYESDSKTGSTRGVFRWNVGLFNFKQSQEITSIGPILLTIYMEVERWFYKKENELKWKL